MTTETTATTESDRTLTTATLAVGAALALVVLAMGLNLGVGMVAILYFGMDSLRSGGAAFVAGAVGGQALVLVLALGYVRWRSLGLPVSVPDRRQAALIAGAVVASVAGAIGLTVARQRLVETETTSGLAQVIGADPALMAFVALLSIVLIAPAEELLFRGAIQRRLRRRFGTAAAIAGASTLFAAWHLLNFSGSALGAVLASAVIGAVSLVWGWAFERTDNFVVPVLVHGLYNASMMGVAFVV